MPQINRSGPQLPGVQIAQLFSQAKRIAPIRLFMPKPAIRKISLN